MDFSAKAVILNPGPGLNGIPTEQGNISNMQDRGSLRTRVKNHSAKLCPGDCGEHVVERGGPSSDWTRETG